MAMKLTAGKGGVKAARVMPGKRLAARGGVKLGARAAKRNAYLLEVLQNDRVRERVQTGIASARSAYGRVSRRGKGPSDLFTDPKARRDLRRSLAAFQEAAAATRGAKLRRRRRIGVRAGAAVAVVGLAGAIVLYERLRTKVVGLFSRSSTGSGAGSGP